MMMTYFKVCLFLLINCLQVVSASANYHSISSNQRTSTTYASRTKQYHHPSVSTYKKKSNTGTNDNNDDANTPPTTVYSSSRINVHIPYTLNHHNNSWGGGGYEHTKANFGFGSELSRGSIVTYVYYIDHPICDPVLLSNIGNHNNNNNTTKTMNVYPERNSNNNDNDDTSTSGPIFQTPFILLIRSSNLCSHVVQVRNGQNIGAAAVVIGQTKCRCNDMDCMNQFESTNSTQKQPCIKSSSNTESLLNDDGSASDISIPSFLLYRIDFQNIITTFLNNKYSNILMEVTWGIEPTPNDDIPDEPLNYHFWTSAAAVNGNDDTAIAVNHNELDTLKQITKVFTANQAIFTPHYTIIDGTQFDCTVDSSVVGNDNNGNENVNDPCNNLCINHGRYCTMNAHPNNNDDENNDNTMITGYTILKETIRQLCIFDVYSSIDVFDGGNTDIYWDYIIHHRTHCSKSSTLYDDINCINDAYSHANIPSTHLELDDCIDTNDIDMDSTNTILEHQLKTQLEYGIYKTPALSINKHIIEQGNNIHGSSEANELFYSICKYYNSPMLPAKNYPDICTTCGSCPSVMDCIDNGHCIDYDDDDDDDDKPSKGRHGWFWTFFFVLIMGGGGYYYYTNYYYNDDISRRYSFFGPIDDFSSLRLVSNYIPQGDGGD